MPAEPTDIAKFTTDGVLIVSPVDPAVSQAIKGDNIDARDGTQQEIEYFFDLPEHAQAMLDQAFTFASAINPPYMAIELSDDIGLGSDVPITPAVPSFTITDAVGFDETLRLRSYAEDTGTDRFSIEIIE